MPPLKQCLDCGTLSDKSRCSKHRTVQHRRQRARRGSTAERGYDGAHQAERARIQKLMDKGQTFTCWRCGLAVDPTPTHWQLGHSDDRTRWMGPEHPLCNLRAGGQAAHR